MPPRLDGGLPSWLISPNLYIGFGFTFFCARAILNIMHEAAFETVAAGRQQLI